MGHAGVTKKMIEGWFSEALRYIANIPGGMEALSDPRRVFNTDESGFAMDAGTGRIKTVMVPLGHGRCASGHVEQRNRSQ